VTPPRHDNLRAMREHFLVVYCSNMMVSASQPARACAIFVEGTAGEEDVAWGGKLDKDEKKTKKPRVPSFPPKSNERTTMMLS